MQQSTENRCLFFGGGSTTGHKKQ
uniref:Uncharacterized protein n=1 Tax=Anguilla anguilla TaxID=7936 RepID=A0A0E9T5V0_ANGAN